MKLIQIYCCSLYSSTLWDLYGKECKKLFNQWNVLVRTAWEVKRETHRRFIEPLSEIDHLKKVLSLKTINFYKNLMKSEKESVRYLANLVLSNTQTTSGKNVRKFHHCIAIFFVQK